MRGEYGKEVREVSNKGWIKLYRQLQDCPIWYGERFSKGQAWVDLLLLANHSDKKIMFNGEFITVGRGQFLTSMVKLSEKWEWNRKTVSSYLNMLEKEKMITKQTDNTKTLITIENYEVFQGEDENNGQPLDNPTDNLLDNPLDSRTDTNKNIKNVKNNNINNRGKNFVPPSVDEVRAYCSERNNKVDPQSFVDFYESKGWFVGKNKMKDWKAAVRTWERSKSSTPQTNNKFNNISQRQYDFDEMEKRLINNNK